ncbi:MAG TPA: FAD-dependent monooxygenase [Terriglobales bacterium]|nr:FAD-dependent monooxygenase [Terriglobales bacterium]
MVRNARVAVVGGSLGGLTAALLLRELGHEVTVHERSGTELEQRGAGIGFLPASSRYLAERARLDLDRISVSTRFIRYLDRQGRVVHEQDQPYRFSNWNTVYRSLLRCFDPDRYLLGRECVEIRQADGRVQVAEAGGAEVEVDLLVCADGIGSRARACLLPDAGPRYAGYVAWRGLVPEGDLAAHAAHLVDAITYYVFANSHVLVYPIPGMDGSVEAGERLINFVWYRNYLPGSDLTDLMTDRDGAVHEVSLPPGAPRPVHVEEMRATAAARLPEPIARVVLAARAPFVQAILDVEVPRMAFGRVCLVGDAAFAVRPHAAAGTAKAADDAWALAAALAAKPDVESALRAWEPGQLELGRNLLERTRRIGRRSQVDCNWTPGDPELIFGLHEPGR